MAAGNEEQELKDRLKLIESMIAEGRCSTEHYGWTFLLWGVAYYVAIFWSSLCNYGLAWPITMVSTCVLMGFITWRKRGRRGNKPTTTIGRSIWSIWLAMGISMFVLLDAMGFSGRADWRITAAVAATLIGTANAASSIILKWRAQFACAVVWWAAAVVCCFGSETQSTIAFLAAIFFCQIVFGLYLMINEVRARRKGAIHA
jgi:hypothetical protein